MNAAKPLFSFLVVYAGGRMGEERGVGTIH